MNSASPSMSSADDPLGRILADYLNRIEEGQEVDRAEVLRSHPEFADEIESFFRNHDAMRRVAPHPPSSIDSPTLEVGKSVPVAAPTTPNRVRYFGDYELIQEIARGGMGVVYQARQVNLKRIVALKMILAGQLATRQDVERFHAEAEAAAKLDHPHIVPIYEVGEHEGQHYFSMAFVEGESLAQKVGRGVLPPREAAELIRQVASAIGYAHVEGVIHRDLKPANILLDAEGRPRVTDFGLAKHVQTDRTELTVTGQILGTPSYMSPEQAGGERQAVGPAADIYSLGAILYCVLTGRPPFQAATTMDTLLQVMKCEPASPRQLNPGIPRDLETICLKCLEKESARRYASAQELAEELQRYLDGRPIHARPISAPDRAWRWCRRNPVVAGLTVATAASLLLGIIVSSYFALESRHQAAQAVQARDRALENEQFANRESVRAGELAREAEANAKTAEANAKTAETNARAAEAEKHRADAKAAEAEAAAKAIQAEKLTAERNLYVAQMNLAQQAWENSNLDQLEKLLKRQRPKDARDTLLSMIPLPNLPRMDRTRTASDLRGFEWYFWQRRLNSHLLKLREPWVLTDDVPGAWSTAYSADGKWIATGEYNSHVKIWNAATGAWVKTLYGHKDQVLDLAFSPDSRLLASAGGAFDGVIVWEVTSGKQLHNIVHKTRDTTSTPFSVAFSPDGRRLYSGPSKNELKQWDLIEGKELAPLVGSHKHEQFEVTCSADGRFVAGGSFNGAVTVWQVEDGKLLHTLHDIAANYRVQDLQFSPDSKWLAAIDQRGSVYLWDTETWKLARSWKPSKQMLYCLAFSPDSRRLAVSGQDTAVQIWNLHSSEDPLVIRGHRFTVRDLAFSPDGERIVTACTIGPAKVWDARRGQEPLVLHVENSQGVLTVAHHAPSNRIASAEFGGRIRLWNDQNHTLEKTLQDGLDAVRSVAFSPNGELLASAGDNKLIRLWDVNTGELKRTLAGHKDKINGVAFSARGERLLSCSGEQFGGGDENTVVGTPEVKVWNTADGAELHTFSDHKKGVTGVAFSPDGMRYASASGADGSVVVRNLATDKVRKLRSMSNVFSVAFSPDGNILATPCWDKNVYLSDANTGKPVRTLSGHSEAVQWASFSSDGKRLVSCAHDFTMKIWDVATGQETLTLAGPNSFITQVVFSSDGRRLIASNVDGSIRVWDADPPEQVSRPAK